MIEMYIFFWGGWGLLRNKEFAKWSFKMICVNSGKDTRRYSLNNWSVFRCHLLNHPSLTSISQPVGQLVVGSVGQ